MTDFKDGIRILRKNTPSRQKYKQYYDEIIKLWREGKGRKYLCNEFNLSKSTIHYILKRLELENPPPRTVTLTEYQKSVLIGTILGDSHINSGTNITSYLNFAHCKAQKEFFDYKVKVLSDLGSCHNKNYCYYDKRTGKTYERCVYTSLSCVELKELRNIFYKDNKKILPIDYLYKNFTSISLAYLYMDDGTTQKYNTTIATQCFQKEEILKFIILLKEKFDIEFTIQKTNNIRVKQKDSLKFKKLISTEVEQIKCMKYKLNTF